MCLSFRQVPTHSSEIRPLANTNTTSSSQHALRSPPSPAPALSSFEYPLSSIAKTQNTIAPMPTKDHSPGGDLAYREPPPPVSVESATPLLLKSHITTQSTQPPANPSERDAVEHEVSHHHHQLDIRHFTFRRRQPPPGGSKGILNDVDRSVVGPWKRESTRSRCEMTIWDRFREREWVHLIMKEAEADQTLKRAEAERAREQSTSTGKLRRMEKWDVATFHAMQWARAHKHLCRMEVFKTLFMRVTVKDQTFVSPSTAEAKVPT
ncbi:hypothetical protein CVT26_001016 [Gymnopilus dilepis]|uniref:Uncharacterized protein n=1 Tax=Gymnopilus dilepis TaxID=231916 RepID=A0A409Y283_9AGAR|nr:hypothetical protein CVT26_001016 [Gymnopilus dilepis]